MHGGGWGLPKGKQYRLIAFTDVSGPSYAFRFTMVNQSPAYFYSLYVSEDMFNVIVSAT